MKKHLKYIMAAMAGVFALSACTDSYEYTPGEPEDPNCPAVYFENGTAKLEVEPGTVTTLDVTVCRKLTDEALSIPLIVTLNEDDAWTVPATVDFAAGAETAVVTLDFSKIPAGETRKVSVALDPSVVAKYGNVNTNYDFTATVSLVKWEKADQPGFWIDGLIGSLFSVQTLPMAVEYEKAVLPSGEVRFRFASPYSIVTPNDGQNFTDDAIVQLDDNPEHVAYVGYPYNADEDLTGESDPMIITINGAEATLGSFLLGSDWGYGAFESGSIYGTLSEDKSKYPLGSAAISGHHYTVTFGANSLYMYLPANGTYVCSKTSTFTTDPAKVVELLYTEEEKPTDYTWAPLYVGYYTHAVETFHQGGGGVFTEDENVVLGRDYVLYSAMEDNSVYKIQPWIDKNGAMTFTMNDDGTITVDKSFTGVTDANYGDIYGIDFASAGLTSQYPCYYDGDNGTFHFYLVYYCDDGDFGYVHDTFQLTGEAAARAARAAKSQQSGLPKYFQTEHKMKTFCKMEKFATYAGK
ncbi:MAG: hypothetical protein HUK02_02935 [Bacteroidaceae bacterium]|nr:hypothetical protein [Bacteroidaceae bacterium]